MKSERRDQPMPNRLPLVASGRDNLNAARWKRLATLREEAYARLLPVIAAEHAPHLEQAGSFRRIRIRWRIRRLARIAARHEAERILAAENGTEWNARPSDEALF